MFNTTLTGEYRIVADAFGFDADMLQQLVFNGLRASFLPDDDKRHLETELTASFSRLRARIGL